MALRLATALLIIGGLNWGLVGFFNFNLVSWLFGPTSLLTKLVYVLVGLSALYEIFAYRFIPKRVGEDRVRRIDRAA